MEGEIVPIQTQFGEFLSLKINHEFINEDVRSYIMEKYIDGFTIKSENGFVNELKLNNLEGLKYLNLGRYSYLSLKDIESLKSLECLKFIGDCENELDFSNLSYLNDLTILYQKKFKNIFKCKNLKKLVIHHYNTKEKDIKEFLGLKKLQFLEICSSPIKNIDSLISLEELENVELRYLRNLESIKGLENHSKISELWIQNCKKVKDIELIGTLENLSVLTIDSCGGLSSLEFLKKLKRLKSIRLVDTKILDGKLSWLLEKESMQYLSTSIAKYYDITHEQLTIFNNL